MTIDPQSLYQQVGYHVAQMPDLKVDGEYPSETKHWLARASALVDEAGSLTDKAAFGIAYKQAFVAERMIRHAAAREIEALMFRVLAVAELAAPAAAQGAFIPAGNPLDAMAAVGKVLQQARNDAFIVDPYMDEKALTDFAVLAPDSVSMRLLADQKCVKPSFAPAVTRWHQQYQSRPLTGRLAPAGSLHDRLIAIDQTEIWVMTQSLNAIAARSPATIARVDHETAALKSAYYESVWQTAQTVQ
jgi:hypothetical protein